MSRNNGAPKTFWNGQPCKATYGTVVCGRSPRPTWWCAGLEGKRLVCVKVEYGNQVFYLENAEGQATIKLTAGKGSPQYGHKSIPVDDHSSFVPEEARP